MSAVNGSYTYEMDASYAADFSRDREPMKTRSRHPEYRRKGSAPTRVSGMHCRRNKRWSWGSGRGARMANLRAFAGCVAVAVAALASQADAQLINIAMNPIGNLGNPANIVGGTNYGGSVSYAYSMATTEVTNAQYVSFLNAVDASGSNQFGLYNSLMGTGTAGGISLNLAATPGTRYSVRSGTPVGGPVGTAYGSMPVNYVNWFSAARFVNWLQAGQPADSTSMNSGVYAVGSGTSGNLVARSIANPNVNTYVLPSKDEWYKAAYYTGTGSTYSLYATNSNTAPTGTLVGTTPNAANARQGGVNVSAIPANVGYYTVASQSAYGMYDMYGNVGEISDTIVSGSNYAWVGGGFGSNPSGWNALATVGSASGTRMNDANGFRVAQVSAVPEPETITLAAFGIVGLCGANWLKRRRKVAAPAADMIAA